jgi:hypothetical protein
MTEIQNLKPIWLKEIRSLKRLGHWRFISLLSARMILGMHLLEMLSGNMGVDLRC